MKRTFSDWIKAYLEYNKRTESATVFHKWAAFSAIGAVLRRKVYFKFGRIKIYPNLYVVLVAEPGIARKTQAISFITDFISDTAGVHLAADATTPQALLNSIEDVAEDVQLDDGTQMRHCSLTIFSGEFESFLGNKKENSRMITLLTDLFDCKEQAFKYNTKHSGSNELPQPFLSILAATTPGSIAECFPHAAIGGGLSSRILFVYADNKARKEAIPELDATRAAMYQPLLTDLAIISRISGEYNYSPDGREWWLRFYDRFDERDPNRLCTDPSFIGWYSRKPLLLCKVATIIAASRSNEMIVTKEHFEEALKAVEEVEPLMGNAFTGVGRSELTADVDNVRKIIQRHGCISEKQIRQIVWRDIDDKKFETVINTVTKSSPRIKTSFKGPKGQGGLWYYYNE